MTLDSILPNILNMGAEKRITSRLNKYWNFLKAERQFPPEREVNPKDIFDIWDNCFIVKADNSCKKEDYKYKYLGQNIVKAYGSDLTGLSVSCIASIEASHLADKYEQVLATKRPIVHEGEFNITKKELLKYRQILLPIGEDGVNITAILGGMSYKVVTIGKQSFFLRFTGQK